MPEREALPDAETWRRYVDTTGLHQESMGNEAARWRRFRAECIVAGIEMRGAIGDPPAMTKIDADSFKQARPKE